MAKLLSKLRTMRLFWAIVWAVVVMGLLRTTAVQAVRAKDIKVFCSRFDVMARFWNLDFRF